MAPRPCDPIQVTWFSSISVCPTWMVATSVGRSDLNNPYRRLGVPVAALLFAAMAVAIVSSFGDEQLPAEPRVVPIADISDQIFGPYLLPFWALSFVLLAAIIGAIVLARKD